jgi:transmembrane sensor
MRREAAAWLARHDRGLSASEQDEFLQWLTADERHRTWLARHRVGWQRLDGIALWRPEHGGEPNPDVLARPRRSRRWFRPALGAIAAGLAVGAGTIWLRPPPDEAAATSRVTNPTPGYERRLLADGSVVELNRGAEIEVNYSATERRIVLRRGEALFTVARNLSQPFVVRAKAVDVRAVGTVFSVRLESESVEVLVTEGKVQVAPDPPVAATPAPKPAAPLVVAGERALISLAAPAAPQIVRASDAEWERLRAWQPQLLDFSSTPLSEVIAEFNRRNRVQIRLADPASASVSIVASIRSDNIDGIVRLVAADVGLRSESRGEYEIVLLRAK